MWIIPVTVKKDGHVLSSDLLINKEFSSLNAIFKLSEPFVNFITKALGGEKNIFN